MHTGEPGRGAEGAYWKSVSDWVRDTRVRYSGCYRGDLTQCFMRGPFAGWSERQVAELADLLAQNATRFPLRGHEELDWGATHLTGEADQNAVQEVPASVALEEVDRNSSEGLKSPPTEEVEDSENSENRDGIYCPVCQSCGEEGCCSIENSIMSHGCKYAEHYAQQVCYDKMIIDEFHKLAEGLGLIRDETGSAPVDPIGDLYDRAWKRVEERYRKTADKETSGGEEDFDCGIRVTSDK